MPNSPLAPTASMIDPALDSSQPFRFSSTQQAAQSNGRPAAQMQNHSAATIAATRFQHQQSVQQQPKPQMPPTPAERSLPARDVSEENVDSAYVQFILYCNPFIPADVETEELRKGFRNPPRSDGNSFSPWTLFGLLQRLDRKEIRTWAHLVMELGVEPPDREKNQSTQKVQQYAVRLKVSHRRVLTVLKLLRYAHHDRTQRWLHAYHIDAFFAYLASKPSSYYTERPLTDTELAETVRDGVPPEEDLAVRALLPEWRPKRGRRKAEEMNDAESTTDPTNSANKRQSARASSADFTSMFDEQYSAAPSSAVPWSTAANSSQADLWTAAHVAIAPKPSSPGQQHQPLSAYPGNAAQRMWRFPQPHAGINPPTETPASPYPHSAITPRASFSSTPSFNENEPKSAHPSTAGASGKSPSRTRKRHAPAISSAWNSGGTPNGKIRGRPPSNRNVQDGPFSTFPANPSAKDAATPVSAPGQQAASQSPPTATTENTMTQNLGTMANGAMQQQLQAANNTSPAAAAASDPAAAARKPSKLQLQVPANTSGPIRLATPPRVLINGESNYHSAPLSMPVPVPISAHERRSSADFFAQLDDVSEADEMTLDGDEEDEGAECWKRRCMVMRKRLVEKEEELRAVKRRVLDAVMGGVS